MRLTRQLAGLVMVLVAVRGAAAPAAVPPKPLIQVAILLDTSNSMDGLIDQARTQLWRVVNEFASARRDGQSPALQVALYEYGNDGLPAEKGYIRRVLPLTTDLDKVSEELFALRTNGGSEYCGQVIDQATRELSWSPSGADLKVIFIAGNEEFTQGTVSYKDSCRGALARGIAVNTIFCGARQEGISTRWKDGAELADGRFMAIDQNAKAADIIAPQDQEIARLGEQLNATYIAWGRKGGEGKARQSAQDANLKSNAGANVQRQLAKSKANYVNSSWDLVDAKNDGAVDLDKVEVKDLPPEMQAMTVAQRKAYVAEKEKARAAIRSRLVKLEEERKSYAAKQMKKLPPAASTLDRAVVAAVRAAGAKKGYRFE